MSTRLYILFFAILMLFCVHRSLAQNTGKQDTAADNTAQLEKFLDKKTSSQPNASGKYTSATFKSTHIINGQSIENIGKGVLDFRIAHRFGQLNEGIKNLYGLDNATTKFDFNYGITDWLMVGFGRSSYQKEYEGFIKIKMLRQTTDNSMPISLSYVCGMSVRTLDVVNIPGYTYYFSNRLYYSNQLLIARKFSKSLSLQLMPVYIHYNLVKEAEDPNDIFALGVGGRIKVTKHVAITGEYYYTIPGHKFEGYNNSVSVGIDIETGGHVFQLFLTNSAAISDRAFVAETTGDVFKGDLHMGFNISRVFTIVKPKGITDPGNKTR